MIAESDLNVATGSLPIGIVGGIGIQAGQYYYRGTVQRLAAAQQRANIVLLHADLARMACAEAARDYAAITTYLLECVSRLHAAGAQVAAVAAVTPHVCIAEVIA